jgi:hypothetical protein
MTTHFGIHQHNDGWSEVTNENEVSGEVDSLIDGIQSPIDEIRETVVRPTGRHTKKPDRYGDYIIYIFRSSDIYVYVLFNPFVR